MWKENQKTKVLEQEKQSSEFVQGFSACYLAALFSIVMLMLLLERSLGGTNRQSGIAIIRSALE